VALVGIRLIFGRWTRALAWGIGLGVAAGVLTMLALGLGALRNSLFLAVSVGLISTGLGFIFALLESRSTLWTRRLLAPFSILPIITPAFVLGLAMIYMFGRRGFVTHTLLGLSTNLFFGPLGVGVAQVLAFTPIAYLVLVGVIHSLDVSLEEAALTVLAAPLVGGSCAQAWRIWRRDGSRHPSPNAGPVEAASAGALGVTIGGFNVYDGSAEDRGTLGDGPAVVVADLGRAVRLSRAVGFAGILVAVGVSVLRRPGGRGRTGALR